MWKGIIRLFGKEDMRPPFLGIAVDRGGSPRKQVRENTVAGAGVISLCMGSSRPPPNPNRPQGSPSRMMKKKKGKESTHFL